MPKSQVTIWHNPRCSNSRAALELIRAAGHEPTIIEYLKEPPSAAKLTALVKAIGLTPRELIRDKEAAYGELGLADAALTDRQLVDAMVAHPVLINRPIVETERGTSLCRPPETVLEILPKTA